MSSVLNKIADFNTKTIDCLKAINETPSGRIAMAGVSSIAVHLLCAGLTRRFNPAKATFGRATFAGVYLALSMTALGAKEAQRQEREVRFLETEIEYLKDKVSELQAMLDEQRWDDEEDMADDAAARAGATELNQWYEDNGFVTTVDNDNAAELCEQLSKKAA